MGDPDHIVNYMLFIAEEVREYMAALGFKTFDEMIGRTDVLHVSERAKEHWKASQLDLSTLLYQPEGVRTFNRRKIIKLINHLILQQFSRPYKKPSNLEKKLIFRLKSIIQIV